MKIRMVRRSIAGRLALSAAAVALAAGSGSAAAAPAGPLNPQLVATDVAPSVLPKSFVGEMRKTQGENCVFDYDADGKRDILLSTHGVGWRLMKGQADGTFTEVARLPVTDRHGCAVGDFGSLSPAGKPGAPDGRLDIYTTIGACQGICDWPFPNELWIQSPQGIFVPPHQDARSEESEPGAVPNAGSEAALAFGVADVRGRGREPLALDVNRDGAMDLFVGNDVGVKFDSPNRLFINKGDGGFREQPLPGGPKANEVGSRCSAAGDYDGDGWVDIMSCRGADESGIPRTLQVFRNEEGRLRDVSGELGLSGVDEVNDAEFADLNGDGRLDLIVAMWNRTEIRFNRGNTFGTVDYTRPADGSMDVAVGDADGDGLDDVYVVLFYNGAGSGRGDDILMRNLGAPDAEGQWSFEDIPIPQTGQGNGDTVQAIPNWGDTTNRAAFLVNNGKWDEDGPWQIIYMTGPSTGPPVWPPADPGPEDPGPEDPGPEDPAPEEPGPRDPGPRDPESRDPDGPLTGTTVTEPGDGDRPAPGGDRRGDAEGGSGKGRVDFTIAQLRINQRISQAAVRRVNALQALLDGRPPPQARTPAEPGRITLTARQLRINQRISQAAVRRVNALRARLDGRPAPPRRPLSRTAEITLTARQLLINQRISQAAVRRVNALAERVGAGA